MKTVDAARATTHSLREQLVLECEAMARYALASGLSVPATVIEVVNDAIAADDSEGSRRDADSAASAEEPAYAAVSAERAPRDVVWLTRVHDELVRLVAPATPRTILLLAEGRRSRLSFLGPVRLVRHMLIVVVALLAGFVLLAMSPDVNTRSGDIFASHGISLLINELFFVAAGGLGAAFAGLFTAYRYIAAGTYDPKYESTYWVRFILGLMAGVILPALIPLGGGEEGSGFTKPLLALLGGFSASVLYQILDRLAHSVESLVQGGSRDVQAAEREAAAVRELERAGYERAQLIGELVRLRDDAAGGANPRRVADDLDRVLRGAVPTSDLALAAVSAADRTVAVGPGDVERPAPGPEVAAAPAKTNAVSLPGGDGEAAVSSGRETRRS